MDPRGEPDIRQMCRICAGDVSDEASSHSLIENDAITGLGEKFISCLGIQLMVDGYPDRVCDYCQLQLNTFYAFVKKAKSSSKQFERILGKPVIDANYEIADSENGDVEYYTTDKAELLSDDQIVLPVEDDDEYAVEYLEPEYMNTFVDCLKQTEEDQQPDEILSDPDEEHDGEQDDEHDDDDNSHDISNETEGTADSDKADSDGANDEQGGSASKQKRKYPYKCKKCSKRFVYKEVYEAHTRMHKGLPGFECPHCPKTFNEKSNFDYHMQDHTNYRPAKCTMCEKSFKNKQDLASHIRCHKDIRKYMCDVCGKRFRSQSHMTYHRYAHFEARNFACDQCPQKFKSPHILRTHKNTVHSTVYRYECETCGRKFKRDHHLVAHRKTHNKPPGKRITRSRKDRQKDNQTVEMVEIVKEEDDDIDITFEDEVYEAEYITDAVTD